MSTTMTTTDPKTLKNNQTELSQSDGNGQSVELTFAPRFDIWEGEHELILSGDMPGVDLSDLDIHIENRQLTIHGKVSHSRTNGRYLHSEYGVGDFHRTFRIGDSIDSESIQADLRDGVLTIHLPKLDEAKARRIPVKAK